MPLEFPLASIAFTMLFTGSVDVAPVVRDQPTPATSETEFGSFYTYECAAETLPQLLDCAGSYYIGDEKMSAGTLGELITEQGMPHEDIGVPELDASTLSGNFSACLMLARLLLTLDMQLDDLNEAIIGYHELGLESQAAAAEEAYNEVADSRDTLQRAYDRACG